MVERINFSRSNISWNGGSRGIFKLVSILEIKRNNNRKDDLIYGLGSSVLAGNMYVQNGLLKCPPYLFQVAGSHAEQVIFRTFLTGFEKGGTFGWAKNNGTGDTQDKALLCGFKIKIEYEKAQAVIDYDSIENTFDDNQFSGTIELQLDSTTFKMEFPIYHMNVKPSEKKWQAETGPVLMPQIGAKSKKWNYYPCFIHFNRFDRVDIFYDFPFGNRSMKSKQQGVFRGVDCKLKLFSI